jgi:hypothetical protein
MTPGIRRPGSAGRAGSDDPPSWLLRAAVIAAVALSVAAFVLWIRDGAGILLDLTRAGCL